MALINIHVESYSEFERKNGVNEHINNRAFEALVLSYSINMQEIRTIDLIHSMDIPMEFINAIMDSKVIKYSFDTEYTVKVLTKVLNVDVPRDNWRDINYMLSFMGIRNKFFAIKKQQNVEFNNLCQLQDFFLSTRIFKGTIYRNTARDYPTKWGEYIALFHNHIEVLDEARNELGGCIFDSRFSELERMHLKVSDKYVDVDLKSLKKIQTRNMKEGANAFVGLCDDNHAIEEFTREDIINILSGRVNNGGFMKMIQVHSDEDGVGTDSRLDMVNSQIDNWKFYNVIKGFANNGCLKKIEIPREDMIALLNNDVISCEGSDVEMLEYEDSVKCVREWLQEGLSDWKTAFYDASAVNIILDIKKAIYKSAIYCILTGEEVNVGRVSVRKHNNDLDIVLPSGRILRYLSCTVKPSIIDKLCIYHEKLSSNGNLFLEILPPEKILQRTICHIIKDLLDDTSVTLQKRNVEVVFQTGLYLLLKVDKMADKELWKWSEIIPCWANDIHLTGRLISKENAYEYTLK